MFDMYRSFVFICLYWNTRALWTYVNRLTRVQRTTLGWFHSSACCVCACVRSFATEIPMNRSKIGTNTLLRTPNTLRCPPRPFAWQTPGLFIGYAVLCNLHNNACCMKYSICFANPRKNNKPLPPWMDVVDTLRTWRTYARKYYRTPRFN